MKTYLGKNGFPGFNCVYLTPDCLEIEEYSPVDVVRHRIFLDDISMVMHSKRLGWAFLAVTGVIAGISALIGMSVLFFNHDAVTGGIFVSIAVVFFGLFIYRITARVDAITIFGRRMKVELLFGFDKSRVQERFDQIVLAIRAAVAETNARIQREAPKPEPAFMPEMPPPEFTPPPPTEVLPDRGPTGDVPAQ